MGVVQIIPSQSLLVKSFVVNILKFHKYSLFESDTRRKIIMTETKNTCIEVFGKRLKELRKENGYTIESFAIVNEAFLKRLSTHLFTVIILYWEARFILIFTMTV